MFDDAGWQSAHPELAARADDPHIQAMARACGMDVESFLMEQFAAGLDATGQQQSGDCCTPPHHCALALTSALPSVQPKTADSSSPVRWCSANGAATWPESV